MTDELQRLAARVIWPGFLGTSVPEWLERELRAGLAGVVYFAQNLHADTAELSRRIHEIAPQALIGIDEEGGTVTRLETETGSTVPGAAQLGMVDDLEATRGTASEIARRCDAVGIDVVLGPVADVNTDPRNPVIGTRAFDRDTAVVARHTVAAVEGIQQRGLAACVKHYPGHGDTHLDSHHALPRLNATEADVVSVHLPPFEAAIQAGVHAVMTAHLVVPAWGEEPATLNPRILGRLRSAGFDGVIVTDALDMAAIRETVGLGQGAVAALAAGADLLCVGNPTNRGAEMAADQDERDYFMVRDAIVDALQTGTLDRQRVAEAARRVERMATSIRSRKRTIEEPFDGADVVRRAVTVRGRFVAIPDAPTPVLDVRRRSTLAVDGDVNYAADVLATGGAILRVDVMRTGAHEVVSVLNSLRKGPVVVLVDQFDDQSAQRALTTQVADMLPEVVVVNVGLPAESFSAAPVIDVRGSGLTGIQQARRLLTGR